MRMLRRLLKRTLLAPFLLLPLLSCREKKPSAKEVALLLQAPRGLANKTVPVPRELRTRTDGSFGAGRLDAHELSRRDPVLALLRQEGQVDIDDQFSATGDGGYAHVLTIRPTADAQASGAFQEATGPVSVDPLGSDVRTPGWDVVIAHPKVVKVGAIHDSDSPTEKVRLGYALAYVDYRYVPTEIGVAFDEASPEFDQLDTAEQRALASRTRLSSARTYGGRAYFTHDRSGAWVVTGVECPRC